MWCGREDLNLHTLPGTCTSSMRVCQFRHDRKASKAHHTNLTSSNTYSSAAAQRWGPCAFNPTHSPNAQRSKRPAVCRPAAPPRIPLRACLSAREIRAPIRSPPNRPPTFLSRRLSHRDSLHTGGVWPHTAGRHSGVYGAPPRTIPRGNPWFLAGRAVVVPLALANWTEKRRFLFTRPPRTGDTAGCTIQAAVDPHARAQRLLRHGAHPGRIPQRAKQIAPRTFFGLEPPSNGTSLS
jgi:hypothetical protein